MPQGHILLCTVNQRTVIGLMLSLLAGILPSPVTAQDPDLAGSWREIFRRPDGPPPASAENPLTPAKIALGARLFSDVRLSGNGARACASCHEPARAFTDGRRRALGLGGTPLRRNTPSLFNLAWGKHFFWDGRAPSLEAQVGMPIVEPQEMGGEWPTILRRLEADSELVGQFHKAFPAAFPGAFPAASPTTSPGDAAISREQIVQAVASYLRSLVSPPTRFDAWIEGDGDALRPAEVRGFGLFVGKAGCVLCHVGWRFTDDRFHDIGLASADAGRGAVPGGMPGLAAFKTPGLRQLELTAPYMHDGSLANLTAVINHYAGRFVKRPSLAPHINRRLRLTAQEKSDLVAFLRTLSSPAGPALAKGGGPN
ncbi:MAG: c-type cytochrome [Hyphomicrobiaceae bacterium]|nr:c-type cytochrome [Hyphomicrobiaceae bacterium]